MAERLIDAEEFTADIKERYCSYCDNYHGLRCEACEIGNMLDEIEDAPAVDAKPVIHAHWEVVSNGEDKWVNKCSACGGFLKRGQKQTNYCPNCGAKIFGKEG